MQCENGCQETLLSTARWAHGDQEKGERVPRIYYHFARQNEPSGATNDDLRGCGQENIHRYIYNATSAPERKIKVGRVTKLPAKGERERMKD